MAVKCLCIFASVGTVAAILSGYKDVVVSNEQSANEATLQYKGVKINHQYSKSSEFEVSYQALLRYNFRESTRYYSLLRPLREIAVSREFCAKYFDNYQDVFSSCNRAFTQKISGLQWCGKCPKCAAVYLLFAPFIEESKLIQLFSKNLLLDTELEDTYRQLLGLGRSKPFECVGEIAESRWAMDQLKHVYPELEKYKFERISDVDVWQVSAHSIPNDIIKQLDFSSIAARLVRYTD